MDEELKIARLVCIGVCCAFLSMAGCVANSDYQSRLVSVAAFGHSDDPIAVGCALGKISASNDLCQIHAVRK